MNIVVEKQPKCVAVLRAEIPAEDIHARREKILAKYASKARIPGYRPGKAPKAVIAKRFQKDVDEELVNNLFSDACEEGMKRDALKVLDFGIPEDLKLDDQGCTFLTRMTLAPEFTLPEYKGVTVPVPQPGDPDEAVAITLQELRERHAEFNDVDGRPAAAGDFVVCDYSSTIDGTPTNEALGGDFRYFAGQEGSWIKLDESSFIPGFATAIIGIHAGESREFPITLPEDFGIPDLAGKELLFKVEAKEVKEAVFPELDDEFAARTVPGKTLDELKELIRSNHDEREARRIDDLKVDRLVATLLSQVDFELPEGLVAQETQTQADAMVDTGVRQGMSNEEIASHQEEIFARANSRAVSSLKSNFLLQEIARVENLEVSDRELMLHIARIAASREIKPDKFAKDLVREGRIHGIRVSMLTGKAIDFLVEHANFIDEPPSAPAEPGTTTTSTTTSSDA